MDYLIKANEWKKSPLLSEKEKQELDTMSENDLQEAFYTNLTFGTGGMRGIMGVGTNRMNVITMYYLNLFHICHHLQLENHNMQYAL